MPTIKLFTHRESNCLGCGQTIAWRVPVEWAGRNAKPARRKLTVRKIVYCHWCTAQAFGRAPLVRVH